MAVVRVTYRLRYYPTPAHERLLRACFDAKLLAWNLSLRYMWDEWNQKRRLVSASSCQRQLTVEKRSRPVLMAASADPTNQALNDLGAAWKNYRAGRASVPSEKRYVRSVRFQLPSDEDRFVSGLSLRLYRIGDVGPSIRWTRLPTGVPKMVTVSEDAAGRWHVSFAVEEERAQLPTTGSAVGIDLGVKEAVCATADKETRVDMPRYFRRYLRRKRTLSRAVSRKVRGSNRHARARLRLAKLDVRVADCRRDWTHKITTGLIRQHDTITVEDLSTKGMAGLRSLAVSVNDAAMREVRRQLEYKAAWAGRTLIVADRFFPSSKLCGDCGQKNAALRLKDRAWTCLGCGVEHDRDSNAARNLLNYRREAGTVSARSPKESRRSSAGRALKRELSASH